MAQQGLKVLEKSLKFHDPEPVGTLCIIVEKIVWWPKYTGPSTSV